MKHNRVKNAGVECGVACTPDYNQKIIINNAVILEIFLLLGGGGGGGRNMLE